MTGRAIREVHPLGAGGNSADILDGGKSVSAADERTTADSPRAGSPPAAAGDLPAFAFDGVS